MIVGRFKDGYAGYLKWAAEVAPGHEEQWAPSNPYAIAAADLRGEIPASVKSILDIGAHNGHETVILAKQYERVVGVELNQHRVDAAKSRIEAAGLTNVKVYQGDIHNLDVLANEITHKGSKPFDCVYANNVLEHLYYPGVALDQIQRRLNPLGGYLVAGLPCDGLSIDALDDAHTWKVTPGELFDVMNARFKVLKFMIYETKNRWNWEVKSSNNIYAIVVAQVR